MNDGKKHTCVYFAGEECPEDGPCGAGGILHTEGETFSAVCDVWVRRYKEMYDDDQR